MCMMVVFLSLVEYAFVNALSRESEEEKKAREKNEEVRLSFWQEVKRETLFYEAYIMTNMEGGYVREFLGNLHNA